MKLKITFASVNQEKICLSNFRKLSEKDQKFHKTEVKKNELLEKLPKNPKNWRMHTDINVLIPKILIPVYGAVKIKFLKYPKVTMFHFGDSGKTVEYSKKWSRI